MSKERVIGGVVIGATVISLGVLGGKINSQQTVIDNLQKDLDKTNILLEDTASGACFNEDMLRKQLDFPPLSLKECKEEWKFAKDYLPPPPVEKQKNG